jgi:purine-cytosine permease-like protein
MMIMMQDLISMMFLVMLTDNYFLNNFTTNNSVCNYDNNHDVIMTITRSSRGKGCL